MSAPRRRYAERTEVDPLVSQTEITRVLKKHGADQVFWKDTEQRVDVTFRLAKRYIRLGFDLPALSSFRTDTAGRWRYREADRKRAYDQEVRRRWRALLLRIKARLESSEDESFYETWMPYLLLPDGRAVHEEVGARMDQYYESGEAMDLGAAFGRALPAPKDE